MTSSSFGSQGLTGTSHVANRSFSGESILVDDESDDHSPTLNIKPEPDSADESDPEPHSTESSLQVDPIAHIVYSKTGSVRLTDQNIELRNVIQRGILEVKGYIAFEHSYPDLVSKNVYAREILLKAAQYHSAVPIEKRMRIDNEYLSALTNLVSAVSLLQFGTDIICRLMLAPVCFAVILRTSRARAYQVTSVSAVRTMTQSLIDFSPIIHIFFHKHSMFVPFFCVKLLPC